MPMHFLGPLHQSNLVSYFLVSANNYHSNELICCQRKSERAFHLLWLFCVLRVPLAFRTYFCAMFLFSIFIPILESYADYDCTSSTKIVSHFMSIQSFDGFTISFVVALFFQKYISVKALAFKETVFTTLETEILYVLSFFLTHHSFGFMIFYLKMSE